MEEFKDFLFSYFQEWEKTQPRHRSSFSAFARWLSKNSLNITIPQATFDAWLNGRYKPSEKYAPILAEKLGDEIYQYLDIEPYDPLLTYVTANWDRLPPSLQQTIQNQIQNYLANQGENNEPTTHPVQT